ncbi:inositol monophosphatase family protein [Acuticoccus sp. I52.16.1]|uniref:inositol monophosphatase family protein n=1 Tax=Acuticoccus sp. I52.16.1 TaxID=2928472 RepID=UPI001FD48C62|nr:inositol monophosphatase family protein [Acuticoccus sp. I52.16.1]UOM33541.1 inositol monophosphatase family protein [Acuticoccus sp. I52.16.1]
MNNNLDRDLLERLADAASDAILPHFRKLPGVDNKAAEGFDPVTVADREAELAMRAVLARERPEDGIFGEEFDAVESRSGRTWILDPIDGTRGFMAGLPTWGVLIALADATGPTLGMMCQPYVGERFVGGRDGATFSRGGEVRPLRTRPCPGLAEATLATTGPQHFAPDALAAFERVAGRSRLVRYGTDCYAYAMLAAGQIDVVVEAGLKPVDIAPFVPIVEAAGGALTDWEGARIGPMLPHRFAGTTVAVGDPALLDAVLSALKGR